MQVKICGLTTLDDALAAAEAGADMLGFNFFSGSPRRISPDRCAEITDGLRKRGLIIDAVGVFVNSPIEQVARIVSDCDLRLAQLHGDETPSDVEALGRTAFKAIRPRTEAEAIRQVQAYAGRGAPTPALLLDAYVLGRYGGTGETADWHLASTLARSAPLLLAGGLTPANVIPAIRQVRPWGVDVASGVERRPGEKDHEKMKKFVQSVRRHETECNAC